MAKQFDATLNSLIDANLADWANFLAHRAGVPPGPAKVLDTDLSSTLQADRLFRIDGPRPAVVHLELESSGRLGIPDELLYYNVAARRVTQLPVHSVVILLRPKATATDLTGLLEIPDANGVPYHTFRYTVVRLWKESFETLLASGLGIAPLAMLTDQAAADLPTAGTRFYERLQDAHLPINVKRELADYTRILCGLRYTIDDLKEALMGSKNILEDSSVYKELVARGEALGDVRGTVKGVQRTILRQGTKRFGLPSSEVDVAIRSLTDIDRLDRLADRVLDAVDWDDLLSTK